MLNNRERAKPFDELPEIKSPQSVSLTLPLGTVGLNYQICCMVNIINKNVALSDPVYILL